MCNDCNILKLFILLIENLKNLYKFERIWKKLIILELKKKNGQWNKIISKCRTIIT